MKLEMERTGQFVVTWTGSNKTQCGLSGHQVLHYRVLLLASDKHLDSNGFIVDNNDVQKYFADTYKTVENFQSCELIATAACRHFRKTIPHLFGIDVAISGNPNAAWLKAHWRKTDTLD